MHRNTTPLRAGIFVGLAVMALAGCRDREERAYGTPRPASPPPGSPSTSVAPQQPQPGGGGASPSSGAISFGDMKAKVVDAKCQRAARCDEIGKDKKWPSKEVCVAETRDEEFAGLVAAKECPHGVNREEVDKCVDDVLKRECGDALTQVCAYFLCVGDVQK